MNVVYSKDTNDSGTNMVRVAEIDGRFFPYRFSLQSGQVTWGNEFAGHTAEGVKFVSVGYAKLKTAVSKLA